ncbi:MAG: hypothetical protein GX571_13445, partial [Lentisphaerae bacterium]|nr:hypothetical protein [Lentisphaerota bacterium]
AVCPECGYEFPPPKRSKHEAEAATANVISAGVTVTTHEVTGVNYSVHVKRDAPEGHPPTMRVEYRLGFNQYVSEWVCFEHQGYARGKAEAWWRARSQESFPKSCEEAVRICLSGGVAEPVSVTVRSSPEEKYPRIKACELGPTPEWLAERVEPDETALPEYEEGFDDDIPF